MRAAALAALREPSPARKKELVDALSLGLQADPAWASSEPAGIPGRPDKPALVAPQQVKARSVATAEGRAALIHSLAHIEFNAINLALDIIWRFGGMPGDFYSDWMQVAKDEARHFALLDQHLAGMGHSYGDFPAHDGLWEMAQRTRHDVLARLALVPRTLEARGLDVSLPIRNKLAAAGDTQAAAILDIILRDEITHVAIGNRWYRHVCGSRGLDPLTQYDELARTYRAPRLRGPFNIEARRSAGFTDEELLALKASAVSGPAGPGGR